MSENLQRLLDFKRSYETPDKKSINSGWYFHDNRLMTKAELKLSSANQPGNHSSSNDTSQPIHILSGIESNGYKCSSLKDPSLLKSYHEFWNLLVEHHSNPLSSLVLSKTMLLPHQVQAAIQVVESLQPRVLIADEVGLGKTIETGLIIKELILKYNFNKVLIAVPAPLMFQWKAELFEKFNENFTILDGATLRKYPDILDREDKVIVSIDLLKIPVYWDRFIMKTFDIVIFDEAHRLRKDSAKATRAYQFAEKISQTCRALLLLTATPFRGKLEEIFYLIHLIDPDILGPYHSFYADYAESAGEGLKEKLAPVVIRRRKIEVGGFTRRFARTVRFNLDTLERSFYDAVTEYVKKEYNRAIESTQNVKAFVMIIFQKLLDSSSYALLSALEKRKERLEQMYYRIKNVDKNSDLSIFDDEDLLNILDDEDDAEIHKGESDQVFNPEEVRQEILSLNRLIHLGKKIEVDMKLKMLVRSINNMHKEGHKKIIIFTQFVNTMKYIANHLRTDFSVTVFHGGLSAKEKEDAIVEFFNKTQVLICTEAGGEGRNLQAASVLINYDLPWSPLKIEQRIGRIHRFGQKSDVYIVNFATKDTIAEKVLEIIERKIKLFEDAFGESDVLLGTSEDDSTFDKNIRNLLNEKKTVLQIEEEIEKSSNIAKKNIKKIDSLLTTEVLDFNMSAFSKALKRKENIKDYEKTIRTIIKASHLAEITSDKTLFYEKGDLMTFYHNGEFRQGSFDFAVSEENSAIDYLTIGHPIVDKVLHGISTSIEKNSAYYIQANKPSVLGYFQAQIHLDRVYNRFYTIFYDKTTGEISYTQPVVLKTGQLLQTFTKLIPFDEIKEDLTKILSVLQNKIIEDVEKIQRKLDYGVNYWKKNLQNSHIYREKELMEKLEVQKGKAKWYGEDKMVGAISRTINQQKDEKKRWSNKISQLEKNLKPRIDLNIRHLLIYGKD
ncbi:MAG: SNF2-related protein [Spirochaetia bacterium]|nr:SNF2-related protein [Spirochaetia bacterium]